MAKHNEKHKQRVRQWLAKQKPTQNIKESDNGTATTEI